MGPSRPNALMPRASEPRQWNERIVPQMLWDESRIRRFDPADIEERLRLMREYPMEMAEDGETFALVPTPPQVPEWRTETMPADPWQTRVFRPNGLMVR